MVPCGRGSNGETAYATSAENNIVINMRALFDVFSELQVTERLDRQRSKLTSATFQ